MVLTTANTKPTAGSGNELRSLADMTVEEMYWHVLLYGEPGVGKTHFLREVPRPLLIFDFDHKLAPLAGEKDVHCISYDVESKDDAPKVVKKFLADFSKYKYSTDFASIAFDSLSILDPLVLRYVMQQSGRMTDMPEIQHWGAHNDRFSFLFMEMNLNAIKKNVFLITHEIYKVEKESNKHKVAPLMNGEKIQAKLPGFFLDTWHMTMQNGERKLWYRQHGKCVAASAALGCSDPGYIADPTFSKVLAKAQEVKRAKT